HEQPGDQGEDEDVTQRVRDRDDLFQHGQIIAVHVRADQDDPVDHADAGGEHDAVQHAAAVPVGRTGPDQPVHPGDLAGAGAQVEQVGHGGERVDLVADGDQQVVGGVPGREAEQRDPQQDPRQAGAG